MTSWCKTPSKPSSGNNADKPYDSAMQSCPVKERNWIDLEYLYSDGAGVAGARYRVIDDNSDKVVAEGILDDKGFAHCPLPLHVKNVSYNFFGDPSTVAYRKQPDLNPEYAKVKPGWYDRMAGSISETGSWVWGTIQGDFNENQTVGQIAANAAITMIPIVDQAGDIRDLIANLKFLIWDKRYDDKWVWIAIVLTLIGLVPFVGSAAKGVLKTVAHGIRTGAKIPLDLLIDIINKFHKGNAIKWLGELASDLPKKHAKTIKDTFNTFLANFKMKLLQLAERLPGSLGKQAKESIQSIDEITKVVDGKKINLVDKNIDAAVEELQQGLNKALESGVDFERKGTTKTKNTRVQKETEPPEFEVDQVPNIFTGKLRGQNVQLPGVKMQQVKYTKRSKKELEFLRKEFNNSKRSDFVKEITVESGKIKSLKEAGLTDSDILRMQDGKIPPGWQVHHKLPLDDGGTNEASNLVLIRNEPAHKVITNTQNELVGDLVVGQTKILNFPVPDGFVYPPKPGMIISP